MKGLAAIALMVCLAVPAAAQGGAEGGAPAADRVAEFLAEGGADLIAPGPDEFAFLDDAGRAALTASLTAYYRYRETGFEHRRAVFGWQLLSSKIIFAAVILLVGVGLYFSWLQFMAAARGAEAAATAAATEGEAPGVAAAPPAGGAGLATTVEASATGIKVSSPVLGVIILVISLAFFYFYLVHVYPISEVF